MLTTETLRDNPEAYLPRDRRRALSEGRPMADRVTGSAMFADISGFTPLTEALANELGPQRGAEELVANIGRVFHAVIDELDRQGGDVIYFAGDAITCWIDGDDGTRAVAAGLGMQQAIEREGRIVTPAGTEIQLGMKVAIAVGRARRFVVGDPDIQLIDVLAGRLIDDLAEAEHHAERGEIVLDHSAVDSPGDRIEVRESRASDTGAGDVGVLGALRIDVPQIEVVEPPPLPEELVKPWLLPDVYERLISGRGEFLAELRPAFPVFLKFGGIDFDSDDDAIPKLDDFVQRAQRILVRLRRQHPPADARRQGRLSLRSLRVARGSRGRRCPGGGCGARAARSRQGHERSRHPGGHQLGPASERHVRPRDAPDVRLPRRRREPLGPADVQGATGAGVRVGPRPSGSGRRLHLGGPAGPHREGQVEPDRGSRPHRLARACLAAAPPLRAAAGRPARRARPPRRPPRVSAGRPGSGRGDLGRGRHGQVAAGCRVRAIPASARPDGPVRRVPVVREDDRLLRLARDLAPPLRARRRCPREPPRSTSSAPRVAAIDPGLVARVPLLEPIVGLEIPDTELTAGFDAKLRKGSLEDLLVQCLRATAGAQPLAIVLEDCHWIDELSRSLLEALVRADGRRSGPVHGRLPTGRSAGRRARAGAPAVVRGDRARRAEPRGGDPGHPGQARAAARSRGRGARGAGPARHASGRTAIRSTSRS